MSTYQVANGKLLKWANEKISMEQDPPLTYIRDKHWTDEFFKQNEQAFKNAYDGYVAIQKEYFEIDEHGAIKQEEAFRDETKVEKVKSKMPWQEDKEISTIEKVSEGMKPVMKEGKTMEDYNKAVEVFLHTEVKITNKPQVISRFPAIIR